MVKSVKNIKKSTNHPKISKNWRFLRVPPWNFSGLFENKWPTSTTKPSAAKFCWGPATLSHQRATLWGGSLSMLRPGLGTSGSPVRFPRGWGDSWLAPVKPKLWERCGVWITKNKDLVGFIWVHHSWFMLAKLTHIIWLTRVYGGYDCSYWNYKLAYIVEPHPVIWMHKNWCNEIWWNYINIDTYMNFDQVHILAMEMWLCTACCLLRHLAPVATSFHEILRSWSSSCASRLTLRWCHFSIQN